MNVEKIIHDAISYHNLSNPDIIIHKTKIDNLAFYFLYCQDGNVWYSEECRLFLYLYDKLSQERIYPFICLQKVDGEDKIGIFIDVNSEL